MKNKNIVMKKTYFEPEMRIVKLHGRPLMLDPSPQVTTTHTNLDEDDDFIYVGGKSFEGR